MPRKKSEMKSQEKRIERKRHDLFDDDDDGNVNYHPPLQGEDHTEDNWDSLAIQVEEELSNLGGKRDKVGTSRQKSLEAIINCIKHSYMVEFLQTQKEQFVRILKQEFVSDLPEEQTLSRSLLCLLCITCGTSWKSLYELFAPSLVEDIVKSDNFEIRAVSLEVLTITHMVWADEQSSSSVVLKLVQDILSNSGDLEVDKKTSSFFQTALDMWCLLMTKLDDQDIVDEILPNDISNIVTLLQSEDLNVRLAAAEALGLLCEVVRKTEEEKHEPYTHYFFTSYFDVEDVLNTLQSTSLHQQRKVNKKDREKQRHGFKDVLSSLQYGTSPTVITIINDQEFEFLDWKSVKCLGIFRHLLATGFQTHMQNNTLLCSILSVNVSQQQSLTKSEKRHAMSLVAGEARDRSQRRNAKRLAKLTGNGSLYQE